LYYEQKNAINLLTFSPHVSLEQIQKINLHLCSGASFKAKKIIFRNPGIKNPNDLFFLEK